MDLVIHNGQLLDPASGTNAKLDVVVRNGCIHRIGHPSPTPQGQVLAVDDHMVVPGLIDMHTHVYAGPTELGIDPDRVGVTRGVTTVIDAGSSGSENFASFRSRVIERAQTRVLAFLNLARTGLERPRYEVSSREYWTTEEQLLTVTQDPAVRGIKARASATAVGDLGIEPIRRAKELAVITGLPLMVHVGNAPPLFTEVLDLLTAGDIVTHCFHGKAGGILDAAGRLIPQAVQARRRGVLFDVGHGTSSFNFSVAEQAFTQGFYPDLCGTDVYLQNVEGPVYDLTATLSKLIALGMGLEQVVALATVSAAKVLGLSHQLGTVAVGREADLSILRWVAEPRTVVDSDGNSRMMRGSLKPVAVVRAGNLIRCGE